MNKEELLKEKNRLESEISALNNKQMTLKILMNSEYGALANKYFRYYDMRLASAITLSGQLIIRWIEEYLMNHPLQKKWKWEVVYCDTDSAYISIETAVKGIQKKFPDLTTNELLDKIDKFTDKIIQPIIDKGYDDLAEYLGSENDMVMKREKVISKCLWTAKKKYAMTVWDDEGVRYSEPKLKVKGLPIVQSSTPKLVRNKLKESIRLLLLDKDKLIDYIRTTKQEFYKYTCEEIAFPRSANNIKKYSDGKGFHIKGTPIHVRGAIAYNNWVETNNIQHNFDLIREGEKIKFVYLKEPNPLYSNVISFVNKFPDEFREYVDYKTMYFKTYLKVLENIKKVCVSTFIPLEREIDLNSLFD